MPAALTLAIWSAVSVTGLAALALLSLGTALGLRVHSGRALPGLGRDGTVRMHRHLTALGTVALVLHIVLAIIDPYTHLTVVTTLVPSTAADAALAYGLGTVATWLLGAVVVTSIARRLLPARLWRTVHLSSYALWAISILHTVLAPSTAGLPTLVVAAACTLLVAATAVDALVLRPAPRLLTPIGPTPGRTR